MGATEISTVGRAYAARNATTTRNVSLKESRAAAVERLQKANVNDQASYNQYDGDSATTEAHQLAAELGLPLAISALSKRAHLSASHNIPLPGPRPCKDSLPAQRPLGGAGYANAI